MVHRRPHLRPPPGDIPGQRSKAWKGVRQVQKYEKGVNRTGAGRLYILARLLDVPIQYFFEEIDARPDRPVDRRRGFSEPTEVRELEAAFLSIPDDSTRQSLVALVRSLARPAED